MRRRPEFVALEGMDENMDQERRERLANPGHCRFDPTRLVVVIKSDDGCDYEVDLEESGTSAELLDWILQVAAKGWCTAAILREFIQCLEDACQEVFGTNLQAVFCCFGLDSSADWRQSARSSPSAGGTPRN